jgi:hypothetical protein
MSNIIHPIYINRISTVRKTNKKDGKKNFKLDNKSTVKNLNKSDHKQEVSSENLYFLQTNASEINKDKDLNYGNNLLDLLAKYRKLVLLSKLSTKELYEIKITLEIYNKSSSDTKINNIIQEIETLANVELAKRGII